MMKKNIIALALFMLFIGLSSMPAIATFPQTHKPWEDKEKWEEILQKQLTSVNGTSSEEKIEKRLAELEEKFNKTQEKIREKWRLTKKIYREVKIKHSFYGSIDYDNGYAVGDFIKFTLNESTGEIFAYTLNRDGNLTVFDFVSFNRSSTEDRLSTHGSVLIYDGGNKIIRVYDNPTGLLKLFAKKNITVTLDVSSNLNLSETRHNILSISGEKLNGKIILRAPSNENHSFSINDNTITAKLSKGDSILFLAEPVRDFTVNASKWQEYENKTLQGIAKGHVGARIMVQLRHVAEVQNRSHIMTYSDLRVNCSVKTGKVVVNVSSNESGKTIIIDVDNSTFNVTKLDKLKVLLDNKNIEMASNYSDVLDPTNDNGKPEYLIVIGSNGVEVLVSVPKFSPHTIVITEPTEEGISLTKRTPGFTFIVLVTALTLLLALYCRREKVR